MKSSRVDVLGNGRSLSFKDADRNIAYAFLILLAASVVAAVALVVFTELRLFDVFPILAFPFTVVGLFSYLYRRHWLAFFIVAVVCVVLYLVYPMAGIVAAFLLVGTRGVAVMAALVQRRLFAKALRSICRSGIVGKRSITDRLAQFIFCIPSNTDTRILKLEGSVKRAGLPWPDFLDTMRVALVPSLLMWAGIFMLDEFRISVGVAYTSLFTITVYIAMFALPWLIFRSLDVRVGTEGGGMSVYRGFQSTLARMSVALVVMLIMVAAAMYIGFDTVWYILASAAMTVAVTLISSTFYVMGYEREAVESVLAEDSVRACVRVGRSGAGSRLDDGVPGTPGRGR